MKLEVPCEILDLRHYKAPQLSSVLEAENTLWRERLHWDYSASLRLLSQYMNAHTLPGYVATVKGNIAGYAFFVYEDAKAVIGDLFAIPTPETSRGVNSPDPFAAHEIEATLLRHLLETLFASPGVERIESQLLLHPSGVHTEQFRKTGFQIHPRLFLSHNLQGLHKLATSNLKQGFHLPDDLDLRPWRDEDLEPASRLIAEAYHGSLDSRINDQYRETQGSVRFLNNIIRYPGCGVFSPNGSQVIVERYSRELVALLLCSRISPQSGHITQLCVHPQFRKRGLAQRLLDEAAAHFSLQGATELTLTVTASNTAAVRLYQAKGYETLHRFDATVWEKG